MKKLIKTIKYCLIRKLGGYTEEQYSSLIESQNRDMRAYVETMNSLINAIKHSNILDTFGGVRYSYSLCKYCNNYPNCKNECKHGESFVFTKYWENQCNK